MLLVFCLVLDKDNKPLIIDQPEDNLDNQRVAEILVPYIKLNNRIADIPEGKMKAFDNRRIKYKKFHATLHSLISLEWFKNCKLLS